MRSAPNATFGFATNVSVSRQGLSCFAAIRQTPIFTQTFDTAALVPCRVLDAQTKLTTACAYPAAVPWKYSAPPRRDGRRLPRGSPGANRPHARGRASPEGG